MSEPKDLEPGDYMIRIGETGVLVGDRLNGGNAYRIHPTSPGGSFSYPGATPASGPFTLGVPVGQDRSKLR